MANTRPSAPTKKNKFEFNYHIPTIKFIQSTATANDSIGGILDDLERKLQSIPDYAVQNFDFKFNAKKPGYHGFNLFNHEVDQKKHSVNEISALTVTKMTTTGRLFAEPTTRSKTKKTAPDRHRGQTPQQFKSSYSSSQTSNPSNTMRFERFSKKGKPTIQWNKKYSSHLNDKTLNTHRLENDTLLRFQEAIKTSTYTPGAMKERYPYLNSKHKDHRFKYIFHDYFNDLLVWHNDTLNKNIANVWDPVKGLYKDIFTIPGKIESLTKEVNLINKYLTSFEVLRSGEFSFCI